MSMAPTSHFSALTRPQWVIVAVLLLMLTCALSPHAMLGMRYVFGMAFSGRSAAKVWYGLGYVVVVALMCCAPKARPRPWVHLVSLVLVTAYFVAGAWLHFWLTHHYQMNADDNALYYHLGSQSTTEIYHTHVGKAALAGLRSLLGLVPNHLEALNQGYDSGWPFLAVLPKQWWTGQTVLYAVAVLSVLVSVWHVRGLRLRWFLPFALAAITMIRGMADGGVFYNEAAMAWPVFLGIQCFYFRKSGENPSSFVWVGLVVTLVVYWWIYWFYDLFSNGNHLVEHGMDLLLAYGACFAIGWSMEQRRPWLGAVAVVAAVGLYMTAALWSQIHRFTYERLAYVGREVKGDFLAWVPAKMMQQPSWPGPITVKESYPLGSEVLIVGSLTKPMSTLELGAFLGLDPSFDHMTQPGDQPRLNCNPAKHISVMSTVEARDASGALIATPPPDVHMGPWLEVTFTARLDKRWRMHEQLNDCLPTSAGIPTYLFAAAGIDTVAMVYNTPPFGKGPKNGPKQPLFQFKISPDTLLH